ISRPRCCGHRRCRSGWPWPGRWPSTSGSWPCSAGATAGGGGGGRGGGGGGALARALALNLGVVAVLGGVYGGRPGLAAAGACLAGVVVLGHALALAARIGRALPGRLAGTVWFYVAAAAALLAGMGIGLWLAGGTAGSADAYRALRLAHMHLNVLGWVGLAVVGTQFTLWPTVLRTRMVPGGESGVRWARAPRA